MALDLPALERPQKATSAPSSAGHWDSVDALVRKVADSKLTGMGELFGLGRPTSRTLLYNAGRILPDRTGDQVLVVKEVDLMKKIVLLVLLTCAYGVAHADGDPEAGKALTTVCVACHGNDGNSLVGAFPNIAGQTQKYLLKQMQEIKSGARPVPTMAGQLDNMSDEDLNNVAAYYASQKRKVGAAKPELVELGESIYRAGIQRKNIAACTACHSPTGSGNGPAGFPALAGQWPEYTELQLKAFRSGERHNDGDEQMMQATSQDLSDEEIAAVASYLYGLQ